VECQVLLKLIDRAEVFLLASGLELFENGVRAVDISGVMLAVMQLELLGGIVWFEGGVIVGELWQ
jgi:hypothetical protein